MFCLSSAKRSTYSGRPSSRSGEPVSKILSAICPEFSRIACSIRPATSGLAFRKALEFSLHGECSHFADDLHVRRQAAGGHGEWKCGLRFRRGLGAQRPLRRGSNNCRNSQYSLAGESPFCAFFKSRGSQRLKSRFKALHSPCFERALFQSTHGYTKEIV